MNFQHLSRLNILPIWIIDVFFIICCASIAQGEQLSQQQADDKIGQYMLILEYRYYSDELVGDAKVPRVRVYDDGLVLVHYPVYMKRAGEYKLTLTPEELRNLVKLVENEGFFQFDEQAALHEIAQEKGPMLTYQSHYMHTEVTAHPAIMKAGATATALDKPVTAHWKDLRGDAQQYDDLIPELKGLQRIGQKFESLADRAFQAATQSDQ